MDELRYTDETLVKRAKRFQKTKEYIAVLLSTLLYTITTYTFVIGNGFASSGFSGILVMTEKLFNLESGTFTLFFMNFPLLIWSWFILSKDFAIKTTISVFVMCLGFYLLSLFDKNGILHFSATSVLEVPVDGEMVEVVYSDFGKKFFCSIVSGIFAGISIAVTFKNDASLGGVDTIVMIIQKYRPHANVSVLLILANALVTVAGYFVFGGIESVCFALIYIFIFSKVCDYILKGVKQALKFEVITDDPDRMAKEIIEKLGHSVTVTRGRGMYENTDKYVLICVIRKNQIAEFENVLKRFPRTFAYCSSVSEIIGTFFKNDKSGRYFGLFSKKNKKPRGVCGCENVAGAGVKVGENHSEEAKNENNDKND
ncbi:MAG: YitT family protein [Candidatus Borkfalkiaceae bacterium]|nr:YitT family protein [Christensenellaceae bacterium]